jgi:AcrR family transcriptional regulator
MRSDARRNRALCIEAARLLFAEHGLDVTFDDVAAKAGLGVATVYRHFASRDALLETVLLDSTAAMTQEAAIALAMDDPAAALTHVVRTLARSFARDRMLVQIALQRLDDPTNDPAPVIALDQLYRRIFDRCRRAGVLHPGVHHSDLPALLAFTMVRQPPRVAGRKREFWEICTDVVLAGLLSRPSAGSYG